MKTIFFFFAMAVSIIAFATQPEPPVYYTGNNEIAASAVYSMQSAVDSTKAAVGSRQSAVDSRQSAVYSTQSVAGSENAADSTQSAGIAPLLRRGLGGGALCTSPETASPQRSDYSSLRTMSN